MYTNNLAKSKIFHSVISKLLYITKRAITDLDSTVAYLFTGLSCSNEDDRNKL